MEMPDRFLLSDEQFQHWLVRQKSVLTTEDAAEYLGMSKQNLELLRLNGGGPRYAKVGRLVRYRREALDAWLVEHEKSHTAEGHDDC